MQLKDMVRLYHSRLEDLVEYFQRKFHTENDRHAAEIKDLQQQLENQKKEASVSNMIQFPIL